MKSSPSRMHRLSLFLSAAVFLWLTVPVGAVMVSSEDFSLSLGTWTAGPLQSSPDSTLSWDGAGERARQSNPGTDTAQITDTHDLDAGHKITINDGDTAIFTVDFQFNNAVYFVDFILADDPESWQAGFRYNHSTKTVEQYGFASFSPVAIATPLSVNTMYTAVVELAYSGGSWNPTFTINGETFVGNPDSFTPAGQTVHQHLQTFTLFNSATNVYYDNTSFEFFPAPEPGTAFSVVLGCGVLALRRRRGA